MTSLGHARSLHAVLRRVLLAGLTLPACTAACGKTTSAPRPEGTAAATTTAEPVVAEDSAPPPRATTGPCRPILGSNARKGGCGWSVVLEGDLSTCQWDAGVGAHEQCAQLCAGETYCRQSSVPTTVFCGHPCRGRGYEGLDEDGAPVAVDVATYLARAAFYEAASADAFAHLVTALRHHGAPRVLIRACLDARADEVRHARMAATLAARHGATVVRPTRATVAPRSLEALATENAVEGGVGESFGVVVGMWQAAHAPTEELRAFYKHIVRDEARHAALAWRVDAFLRARLDRAANARVDRARDEALVRLARSIDAPAVRGVGLPAKRDAQRLFDAFVAEVTCFAIPDGGCEAAA